MNDNPTRDAAQSRFVIASWGALAIGAFFAVITLWVLLADVIAGAPLTPAHAMSAGAVLAAIASGHYAWPQFRKGAVMPAFLLSVLFVAATSYVVVASAARNAETGATKSARIAETNGARERELRQLAMAEAMHKSAVAKLDADCVKGKASRGTCDGIRATIAVYDAAIRGHKSTLASLGPALAVNGGFAHAARTLASIPGITASPEAIEERLVLLLPFLAVIIAEIGTIVFLHMAIGHAPVTVQASVPAPVPAPVPPTDGGERILPKRRVATKAAAQADVIQLVARGERIPTQSVLAARWGVHSGTACKWLCDFERAGIIRQTRNGRAMAVIRAAR